MTYDFESLIPRHGMDAIAVDRIGTGGTAPDAPQAGFSVIPMWVADMNFATSPAILQALSHRLEHPLFGYFPPSEAYYQSIIQWQEKRHGVQGLSSLNIGYDNGVLGGVVAAANALCSPGDSILVHSPTYIGFTGCLGGNGYHLVHSPLQKDEQGIWRMDLQDMEAKIIQNHIHTAIFCSPHNPTGRVWETQELEAMLNLFEKYQVYIISDEIWADLILPGSKHIPTQSVSAYARTHTVSFYAPTKTFNLAGLVGSYDIIYDTWLRDRVNSAKRVTHFNQMNVLSMHALIGAYSNESQEWLDQLLLVLARNIDYAYQFIHSRWEGISVSNPQGTYMLFMDCKEWLEAHHQTMDQLEKACWNVGVALQDGRAFFGETSLRVNCALPFTQLQEAFQRLDQWVFNPKQ